MALSYNDKKAIVKEVASYAKTAHSAVAAEYRGITVDQMTQLRKSATDSGVYLKVVKNTLAKIAIQGTQFECMQDSLKGPLVLAFSMEDPGSSARLVKNFAKECDLLMAKLICIGGELFDSSHLAKIASLPTKMEAISILMSVIKAPITKMATTLNEVPSKLVRTISAVKDSK
ncbi:MAG: 50S ribosomal protein L10 [Gammaproteobacteria bacterium]|nr:MAG: 50S ribosomal protein L10 [Gammaproteobacteria bacterium]